MTDDFAQKLGARIRELRKIKKISQLDLAYDMDMSMNTISGIELGKISPKIETLKKISSRLGVNISDLFNFSDIDCRDKIVRKKVEEISHRLLTFDAEFLDLIDENISFLCKVRKRPSSPVYETPLLPRNCTLHESSDDEDIFSELRKI